MISVMSKREIDPKPTPAAASDLPFFVFKAPRDEPRISPGFDQGRQKIDLEARVPDAGERDAFLDLVPRSDEPWMHGFQIGDMVWGKVKSHPWWPGHIFNEAFASPSVRRTKREGHVLVAFFGDSSYGWFDPAELIPFGPHYPEKSKQTTSRTFLKAVEEASDEASRRGALALTCCCRNPYNFRPTDVPGYFGVDVVGYEPSAIYSSGQITKARESFTPVRALYFVQKLALAPRKSETEDIDDDIEWTRNMATILAYRRAVFEEFDETYAQAFGQQMIRPSPDAVSMHNQADKFAPRAAPLSGSLVIAESLSDNRSLTTCNGAKSSVQKQPKVTSSKKNKYEFKRREDQPSSFSNSSSTSYSYFGSILLSQQQQNVQYGQLIKDPNMTQTQANDYVLQKRPYTGTTGDGQQQLPVLNSQENGKEESDAGEDAMPPVAVVATRELDLQAFATGAHASLDGFDEWMSTTGSKPVVLTAASELVGPVKVSMVLDSQPDLKDGGGIDMSSTFGCTVPKLDLEPEKDQGLSGMGNGAVAVDPSLVNVMPAAGVKKKVAKRLREDDLADGKKKKRKNLGIESGSELLQRKSAGKFLDANSVQTEHAQSDLQKKDVAVHAFQLPKVDVSSLKIEFSQVISDLSELAVNPFYGSELNVPSIVGHVVLKFRSLVYQKSLVLPPASEPVTRENKPSKLAAGRSLPESHIVNANARVKEPREPPTSLIPLKPSLRPDDPTRSGRKRGPSYRQEDVSAKRLRKLHQLKALAAGKKAVLVQKTPGGKQQEERQTSLVSVAATSTKTNKPEIVKKPDAPSPPRVISPTYLVMKFPPRTTLPSISSLKAKFGRFGSLDTGACRVFWKSYTCRVVFMYNVDALAAYNHAKNNDLFGQIKVAYSIREVEKAAAEPPVEPAKQQGEPKADVSQIRPGNGNGAGASVLPLRPLSSALRQQQPGQLKSILKKPNDDVNSPVGSVTKDNRVKFMLGGDDDRKKPPTVVASSNNNGGSKIDTSSCSLPGIEPIIAKQKSVNFQLEPPFVHPSLPHPPPPEQRQFSCRPPDVRNQMPLPSFLHARGENYERNGLAQVEIDTEMDCNNADISHQMFSLLLKCNDIVSNLKTTFGYVPYHPL